MPKIQAKLVITISGIILIILGFVAVANGFSCYACQSGEACEDITESMKQKCTSPLGAISTCVKARVSGNVVRACGVPGTNINECRSEKGATVCMCTTELCNGAERGTRQSGILFATLVINVFAVLLAV